MGNRVRPFVFWLLGFALVLIQGSVGVLSAPYYSYTYDYWGHFVPSPQAYVPTRIVDGRALGIANLQGPQDVFVSHDGKVYVADTGNHRILVLKEDLELHAIFSGFKREGVLHRFSSPSGVYVSRAGHVYVADTAHARIVVLDQEGEFLRWILAPERDADGVIEENFRYRPLKVAVDATNRVYVVAEDVFDGILEFDGEGHFRGFVGAPRVVLSLTQYLLRQIATKEQKERMLLFLPTEYSNLDLDERGFIYTTVSSGSAHAEESIRRLNPSGVDVLRRRGFHPPLGDYGAVFLDEEGELAFPRSTFVDIFAREYGMYSALDRTRGRVFTYDSEGNLLYVFGGLGTRMGTFQVPTAIAGMGDTLLILDSRQNTLTVFEPTLYATRIHQAIEYHYTGQYDEATRLWQEILGQNANFDLAYTGIGNSYLRQDDFKSAMAYFQGGQNREQYAEAYALFRRQVLIEHFGWFMYALFLLSLLRFLNRKFTVSSQMLHFVNRYGRHLKEAEEKSFAKRVAYPVFRLGTSLSYARYVMVHPFDGFWDLKHEKRGSSAAAYTLVGLFILSYLLVRQYTGFIFNTRRPSDMNLWVEALSVMIPFVLWCIVSWSLTTLMEGKGTLKDIVVASAYACTPILFFQLPLLILSHLLTGQEGVFYYLLLTFSVTWSFFLLFIGTMVTHQYSALKTILTCLLTLVGIAVVLFILVLLVGVLGQVLGFIYDIHQEFVFRR